MDDVNIDLRELAELFGDTASGESFNMMQQELEKEIKTISKRLSQEYKQAEKELQKKADEYFKKFEKEDAVKKKMLDEGSITKDEYIKWRSGKMLYNDKLNAQIKSMSEYLASVDEQAMDVANKRLPRIYANNYNYARYEVEKGFGINTSFTLFDERTVERLARDNPKLLPKKDPDKIKGKAWSKRKINNVITQGVLQGKDLRQVAKDLSTVVGMEERAALRNARTAMTGAQNAGRLDSYKQSKRLGIKLKKEWMATLDERTRNSHADLDGEKVDIDKKFNNELEYPADPEGAPAEVYNCRCTMVADLEDYPDDKFQRYDNIDGVPIENVTYKQWAEAKGVKVTPKAEDSKPLKAMKNEATSERIDYNNVKKLKKELSMEEIIEKVGGGDMTKGSCVSVAYTYAANRSGLDVLDFRGGKSQYMFSQNLNIRNISKLNGVKGNVVQEANDFVSAKKLVQNMEQGKEYILATGQHCAVVRMAEGGGYEYLELQSPRNNGWHKLDGRSLKDRFGCKKSHSFMGQKMKIPSILIDAESLGKSSEFKDVLGYINTVESKQRKGRHGTIK